MKKILASILSISFALSLCAPAVAAPTSTPNIQPLVTYSPSLTAAERDRIHAEVDALSGDVGDAKVGDGTYDPLTLVGAMLDGSSYDSLSRGRGGEAISTTYPFPVNNNVTNDNEYDRKVAKLTWVVQLAKDLGFPVVVQRQADKTVYVEIGDPNAPEMVMALSHLDSSTSAAQADDIPRWRNAEGEYGDRTAYHTPYVKDGWVYGTGLQDDSGPTLATLFAAKALMEAGAPMDRRIRIVMGIYEDGGPGTPTVADTLSFMDIPYYDANPGFYDNWAYKSLNREETPIAGYTSDSRFPVVVGNTKATTPNISMDLSRDAKMPFHLLDAGAGVTLRAGDPTLKDIAYGSTTQVASRAEFTLDVAGVDPDVRAAFTASVETAATQRGWLPTPAGTTPKVELVYETADDTLVLKINTDVAMEMPTPQYSKNAVVWGMYLLSVGLDDIDISASELALKKAADGFSDLFFRGGVEGEAYIGKNMGIAPELLRNPDNAVPNMTIAPMASINTETLISFYNDDSGSLTIPLYIRYMFTNATDYNAAAAAVTAAWRAKGFEIEPFKVYENPTLYIRHDNPLVALQFASYQATIEHDPDAFSDIYGLLDISSPMATTGGTLAGNFQNKMTAFGAVIPGNERWWHTANERAKVDSIVQMTKMMADGMLEMARYSGPAGAQLMWADIDGLNANRADLDLLDVTIDTYRDASSAVTAEQLNGAVLAGATTFEIPMWKARGNSSFTAANYEAGHGANGVYLPTDSEDFLENTFVLPMRLEFKVEKPNDMSRSDWNARLNAGAKGFSFNILQDGNVVPLTAPTGGNADQYFALRRSLYDSNTAYVSVNLAITDNAYSGVSPILADSKTDLYSLKADYLANNENVNPFPERGTVAERGFFLLGDGAKDAEFISPDAVYLTMAPYSATGGGGGSSSSGGDTSSTTKNPDGSTTVTVTDKTTGAMNATTTYPNGTKLVTTTTKDGKVASSVQMPENVGTMTVSVPVKAPSNSLVAVVVLPDGTRQVIKHCVPKDGALAIVVSETCKLELVDNKKSFQDVSGQWFQGAVDFATSRQLFSGMGDGTFAPTAPMTRAMLWSVLLNLDGATPGAGDSWYAAAQSWAQQNGLSDGANPNGNVTREQVAVMMYNFAKGKGYDITATQALTGYTDAGAASGWAKDALSWAVGYGLLSGKGNATLDPTGNATRAEMAQIFQNFLQKSI